MGLVVTYTTSGGETYFAVLDKEEGDKTPFLIVGEQRLGPDQVDGDIRMEKKADTIKEWDWLIEEAIKAGFKIQLR